MPTKEEQLKVIQEVFGNKELSFGCRIEYKGKSGIFLEDNDTIFSMFIDHNIMAGFKDTKKDIKVLSHPVMMGDVLDKLNIEDTYDLIYFVEDDADPGMKIKEDLNKMLGLWKEKRKSIEYQTNECIQYIYELAINILDSKDK